jgi:S1-C subfamily serine protease
MAMTTGKISGRRSLQAVELTVSATSAGQAVRRGIPRLVFLGLWIGGIAAGLLAVPASAQPVPRVPVVSPPSPAEPVTSQPPLRAAANLPPVAAGLAPDELTPEERVYVSVYEQVNRSVVNITTKAVRADNLFQVEAAVEGAGSGSVLDQQGHVLTNYHVVEGATSIRVALYNGESFDARIVGHDAMNDIAVLRVTAPAEDLFPVRFADSAQLRVGQRVIAIGNPFGLERTMTLGIVSSLNRTLPTRAGRSLKSLIQIDAALNRGNSGGPLLDSRGRLIGMNTAIASSTGENTGVGFAIPANILARVVPQLIETGRVIRPDIGITRVLETERGLVIVTLSARGPAEQAGLLGFRVVKTERRRGPFVYTEQKIDRSRADMIVSVDGRPVRSADDLMGAVEAKRPGETVELGIVREGKTGFVVVTLGTGE